MPRVISHPGEPRDDLADPRQGPQICGEPVGPRTFAQGHIHAGQLLMVQARPTPQPAHRLQPHPAVLRPGVVPAMRRLATDPEPLDDRRLRRPPGKQARRFEPARFQRGDLLLPGHASAWHRSP